jgi:dCTP deaminase
MILSDVTLRAMLPQLIQRPDPELVNPASIDIRIGKRILGESQSGMDREITVIDEPYLLDPGEFVLVPTMEWLMVPNGFAMELRLKSSSARRGYDHSLAFWFDPGWSGIGTMEIRNVTRMQRLPLKWGQRFAQIIVHKLDRDAEHPYQGRYQGAAGVEPAKS